MKRDYPLAQSPDPGPRKPLLSVKRVREVADSLDKESLTKLKFASEQGRLGSAIVDAGHGNTAMGPDIPTGKQRLELSRKAEQSASSDRSNASRYRSLANKASKKK